MLGAEKPTRLPRFVARLFTGEAGVVTDNRDPRRVEREGHARAGWRPAYPSWRRSSSSSRWRYTDIEWRATFDRTLRGRLIRGTLQRIYGEVVNRQVAAAEATHD